MKLFIGHSHQNLVASFVAIFVSVVLCGQARANDSSTNSFSFSFKDQFKNPMVLKPEFDQPMIVTVADKEGSEQLIEWIEPLTKEFGTDVSFFAIADLRKVPGPLKGMIRRSFKKRFEYEVAMDWDGVAVKQLLTKAKQANLILLNRQGKFVTSVHGKVSEQNFATMVKAVRSELALKSIAKSGITNP